MEYLIVHLVAPVAGKLFFRIVRRFPLLFAAVAIAGECFGLWAVGLWPGQRIGRDPVLALVGIVCLLFYSFLLVLLLSKLRNGTWHSFCDNAASHF